MLKSFAETAFPASKTGRPRAVNTDVMIEYIFYMLRTGVQWRLLPVQNDLSWQTVHRHFQNWSERGIFQKTYEHLLKLYLHKFSKMRKCLITDSSFIKNMFGIDCLGPSSVDRGRKASKLSIIVDELGVVWNATFHPGNKSDGKAFVHTLTQARYLHPFVKGKTFYADKAYDSARCDAIVEATCMENKCCRRNIIYPFCSIRARVEHVFAWLDKYRRILVRYERKIVNYKSLTYLALLSKLTNALQKGI